MVTCMIGFLILFRKKWLFYLQFKQGKASLAEIQKDNFDENKIFSYRSSLLNSDILKTLKYYQSLFIKWMFTK